MSGDINQDVNACVTNNDTAACARLRTSAEEHFLNGPQQIIKWPTPKGAETFFSIKTNDGVPGGDERTYGMYVPDNFDSHKPTRLIIAAHGIDGGQPDHANGIMMNELDPAGHAKANTAGDNVVYVFPVGKNEKVPTVLSDQTPVQGWRTPGNNLLPDGGKQNDLISMHDVIADAESKIHELGSSVYTKEAFGFSDGGRLVREYNQAYPGEFSYVESDHGTSLGNNQSYTAPVPTTIVESGPTYNFPIPSGGSVDTLVPTLPMLPIGDRMLPPEGGVGAISVVFNTPGFPHSRPMQQVDEALAANKCTGDPEVISGDGLNGHGRNTVETTWTNCPGGYVKLVQEYLDPNHQYSAGHAVNDTHWGTGGMPVVGSRSDNNEVGAWRARADEIARQKLLALGIKPLLSSQNHLD